MIATVVSVGQESAGSSLAADLALTATAVPVVSARDFPTSGECVIAGSTLAYTGILYADEDDGVTKDTLTLAAGSPVAGTAYVTAVTVPGSVEYVAQVLRKGADNTESAIIDHALISDDAVKASPVSDGALVRCERIGGVLYLTKILSRAPKMVVPNFVVTGTLTVADGGMIQLSSGAALVDSGAMPIVDGDDTGSLPSAFGALGTTVAANTADITTLNTEVAALMAGGGGGGGLTSGTVVIDCGGSSISGGTVLIDCGGSS